MKTMPRPFPPTEPSPSLVSAVLVAADGLVEVGYACHASGPCAAPDEDPDDEVAEFLSGREIVDR